MRSIPLCAAMALALAACQGPRVELPQVSRMLDRETVHTHENGPPGAAPGTCWGRDITPAQVETVTEHFIVQPAEIDSDGTVRRPAVFRTETRQRITREREEIWFRAPCPEVMDTDFVMTMQRALAARGHHHGALNGRLDGPTRAAIRSFQQPQGLDSSVLSLAAARQLGLLPYDLEDL